MAVLQKKIETGSGIYTVKVPIGRLGSKHFSIVSKASPTNVEKDGEGNPIITPRDRDLMMDAFGDWSTAVLPHIVVDGPFTFDEMPGEDQYALFMALVSDINVSDELFRFVD